jgi:hypothetical protein
MIPEVSSKVHQEIMPDGGVTRIWAGAAPEKKTKLTIIQTSKKSGGGREAAEEAGGEADRAAFALPDPPDDRDGEGTDKVIDYLDRIRVHASG